MNETIKRQLEHRTIREFKDKKVPEELMDEFFDVMQRTATSVGMQMASVIRVTDPEVKKKITEVCGQEYVARMPELFIFIVDTYRNEKIAEAKEEKEFEGSRDMDRFMQGFTDGCLMAQNLTNAVESEGLGAVYLGSVQNDPAKIIEILNLPELTFPIVAVGFGYPDQKPQLKPRMDMKFRVFENEYKILDNYDENFREYDEVMQTYYDLRDANRRVDSFSNQVVSRLQDMPEKRKYWLNVLKDQGFNLRVEE